MTTKSEPVGAVVKVFAILNALAEHSPSSLADLETQLAMPKSTIYRFLQTMQSLGFVGQNPETEQYFLTMELFHLGAQGLASNNLVEQAHPLMQGLGDATGETVHLGTLDIVQTTSQPQAHVIYIHKIESQHSLRMSSYVGRRADIYSTAMGKILTAFGQRDEVIYAALSHQEFVQHTKHTLPDLAAFKEIIPTVKAEGVAFDQEENEENLMCIAAPVFNHLQVAIASISVSFPIFRSNEEIIARYQSELQNAAAKLSGILGYRQLS